MQIVFDKEKLKIVPIDQVRPNTWNPKDKNTVEYEKVKKSLELHGLKQPIIVRENKGFEIIDGEQKWTGCKKLGWKEVLIYNEGKLGDKEAKELTIAYQQQVPFNELELSKLVNTLVVDFGKNIKVPYSELEMKTFDNLANYNFEKPPEEWVGMPEFEKFKDKIGINVSFETENDREKFMDLIGAKVINKTVGKTYCIWWPEKARDDVKSIEFE